MEKKEKEPELVDFVVTARKYKTTLTEKYKNRKMWHKPFAGDVVSHLPGTVEKLCVSQGQEVQAGDLLLILEAMKSGRKQRQVRRQKSLKQRQHPVQRKQLNRQ